MANKQKDIARTRRKQRVRKRVWGQINGRAFLSSRVISISMRKSFPTIAG